MDPKGNTQAVATRNEGRIRGQTPFSPLVSCPGSGLRQAILARPWASRSPREMSQNPSLLLKLWLLLRRTFFCLIDSSIRMSLMIRANLWSAKCMVLHSSSLVGG